MTAWLKKIIEFSLYSVLNVLIFVWVYGFTNHRPLSQESYYHWYGNFELSFPFIDWTILIYFSLNLLTGLTLFVLDLKKLRIYAAANSICTLLAGLVFYLFPTQCGHVRPDPSSLGIWSSIYEMLYRFDGPHNLVPSLHITYSMLAVLCLNFSLVDIRFKIWRIFLWLWLFALVLSVLFTHQHHLLDIGTGLILGYAVFVFFYKNAAKKYF
jgi:hypothetical protein